MSRIRGKNTKPELLVRKGLHARGFRFCIHNKSLTGSPDIVPQYGVVITLNGCFWHGHKGCRYVTKLKSNMEFWEAKFARNRHRDEVTNAHLYASAEDVRNVGKLKKIKEDEKRQSRALAIEERKELCSKLAELEAEINVLNIYCLGDSDGTTEGEYHIKETK